MGLFSTAAKQHPNFVEQAAVIVARSGRHSDDLNTEQILQCLFGVGLGRPWFPTPVLGIRRSPRTVLRHQLISVCVEFR